MPKELLILVTPHLRRGYEAASRLLKEKPADLILLPFPKRMEEPLRELADGAPYEYFLKEVERRGLAFSSIGAFDYFYGPLLAGVREIKGREPKVELACYKDEAGELRRFELAAKLSALTFRAFSTGKINLKDWIGAIEEGLRGDEEVLWREAGAIRLRAIESEKSLCVANFEGKYYFKALKGELAVSLTYAVKPYLFTPIEALKKVLSLGRGGDEGRYAKLVKCHLKYIREYVLPSGNLDEAYRRWVKASYIVKLASGLERGRLVKREPGRLR